MPCLYATTEESRGVAFSRVFELVVHRHNTTYFLAAHHRWSTSLSYCPKYAVDLDIVLYMEGGPIILGPG